MKKVGHVNVAEFKSLLNWSASTILKNNLLFKEGYGFEKIGNILLKNRNRILILDEGQYKRVTIRLYGKGVFLRDLVTGKSIGTKNQFAISKGQFIMSKIDARNGAFGIVPSELDGAIVTQDFMSYNINTSKVIPEFFLLITSSNAFSSLCQQASSGTTGRQRINESVFLDFEIPIPSIPEQIQIVREYEAKTFLSLDYKAKAEILNRSVEATIFDSLGIKIKDLASPNKIFSTIPFKDLFAWNIDQDPFAFDFGNFELVSIENYPSIIHQLFRGKSPEYNENGTHIILNQKCNRWNFIDLSYAKKVDDRWYASVDSRFFTQEGDILINSTGEGTIGRSSVVTNDTSGLIYDSHILLLRLNFDLVDPNYFVFLLNSKFGQMQIEKLKSAKSTKQTELGIANLSRIAFPLPPLSAQKQLVQKIEATLTQAKKLLDDSEKLKAEATSSFEASIFY